jgi:hypothetical protein
MRAKSLDAWYRDEQHALFKRQKAGMISPFQYFKELAELRARYKELSSHGCRLAPES